MLRTGPVLTKHVWFRDCNGEKQALDVFGSWGLALVFSQQVSALSPKLKGRDVIGKIIKFKKIRVQEVIVSQDDGKALFEKAKE